MAVEPALVREEGRDQKHDAEQGDEALGKQAGRGVLVTTSLIQCLSHGFALRGIC